MNIVLEIDGVRHRYTECFRHPCETCSLSEMCLDHEWLSSLCFDLDTKRENNGHFIKEENNEDIKI